MNSKDILEIKRRFKKESATFSRLCGCYVNSEKAKVTSWNEQFWDIEEDDMFRYLEIAGKVLSGHPGDQLMELTFEEEDEESETRDLLIAIRDSKLLDQELIDKFFDRIIEAYNCVGNYVIILYHDIYDIPMKTTDNMLLDDSEEVYEYLVCAICPVTLSKAALGYREEENCIGSRSRDWIVTLPESGFVYPAFSDRSCDNHHIMFYTKNVKDPDSSFWEEGLCAAAKLTSTQKRLAFEDMLKKTIRGEPQEQAEAILDVEDSLNTFIAYKKERIGDDEQVYLSAEDVEEVLTDSGLSEHKASKIATSYSAFFPEDEIPLAEEIVDSRALKNNELRIEKKELQRQVVKLNDRLREAGLSEEVDDSDAPITIRIAPERADEVTSTIVDGQRVILIPIEDEFEVLVNGESMEL